MIYILQIQGFKELNQVNSDLYSRKLNKFNNFSSLSLTTSLTEITVI